MKRKKDNSHRSARKRYERDMAEMLVKFSKDWSSGAKGDANHFQCKVLALFIDISKDFGISKETADEWLELIPFKLDSMPLGGMRLPARLQLVNDFQLATLFIAARMAQEKEMTIAEVLALLERSGIRRYPKPRKAGKFDDLGSMERF